MTFGIEFIGWPRARPAMRCRSEPRRPFQRKPRTGFRSGIGSGIDRAGGWPEPLRPKRDGPRRFVEMVSRIVIVRMRRKPVDIVVDRVRMAVSGILHCCGRMRFGYENGRTVYRSEKRTRRRREYQRQDERLNQCAAQTRQGCHELHE